MRSANQNSNSMTQTRSSNSQFSALARWLLLLGLLVAGIGGAFLPWVWRPPAALQLTAPGLAEFVKFLPEVRLGRLQIERLYFLLPLFVSMLALPLVAENKALALPTWLRWLLRLLVVPLALAALSPVWTPAILISPEFRLQTALAGLAIGLAIIAPLFGWLPLRLMTIFLVGFALFALILPAWQFWLLRPGLAAAYGEPVSLGWGWWVTAAGLGLSVIGGIWLVVRAKS